MRAAKLTNYRFFKYQLSIFIVVPEKINYGIGFSDFTCLQSNEK